ncbi:MAG TPA: NAD-binding protein [Candidatus Lustribacter sp.]|nr:NAD-binding protein [Candidatus Lustribacter sp.]
MGSLRRIKVATIILVAITVVGTIGYMLLGFTVVEAMYQTITTLATVGFREVRELSTVGQVFTMMLIVTGVGAVLYNIGVVFEALTEGHLRTDLERRRMDRQIAALSGHVIICGNGRVGRAAKNYLTASGQDVVVVDIVPARVEHLRLPYIIGDCTRDDVLKAAGIARARALIAALETDADTVYVTLSARALRPDLVIVSRARTTDSKDKLVLAGATRAVNPQRIGGLRLAAFAMQPDVAEFLDVVMHDEELDLRIQEVHVPPTSALVGRTLGDIRVTERTGGMLLAMRTAPGVPFIPSPPPATEVPAGAVLIAFGTLAQVDALRHLARA